MKRLLSAASLLALSIIVAGAVVAPDSFAAPAGTGTVRVTVATPDGIPATVALAARSTYVATKGKPGTTAAVTLQVPAGSYQVRADSMTIDGRFYVPTSSRPEV